MVSLRRNIIFFFLLDWCRQSGAPTRIIECPNCNRRPQLSPQQARAQPQLVSPLRRLPVLNLNPQAPPFVPQNAQPAFVLPVVPLLPPAPARRRLAANPPPQANVQQLRHVPARRRLRGVREPQPSTTTAVTLDSAGEQLVKEIADDHRARLRRFTHNCDMSPPKKSHSNFPIEDYEQSLSAVRHREELKLLDEVYLASTETYSLWPNHRRAKLLYQLNAWLERFHFEKEHLTNLRQELAARRSQLKNDRKLLTSIGSMLKMTSAGLSDGFALKRRFATCDSRDYAIEQGTTQFIVMASVKKLAEIATVLDPAVEKNIGFGQVIASDSRNEELVDQEAFSFQITAKEFAVPSDETTYWCIVQKMPEQVAMLKHHAIKMEAIVQDGNEHLVHHMEIFHCEKPQKKEYEGRCRDKWRPRDSNSCNRVIAAWAKGAQAFIYPPEAGLPLGGRDSVPYIMVEIHYNNEKRVSGVVDSSGFKFTVTPNLRANDAGIMEIGLIYSDTMSIPPQQRAFPLTAFCPSACTKLYPDEGINIFGSQLHAHLTGRKLWTSIYRKGVKIGEINRDNHYSPHWQHIQKLEPSIRVRRGDVLMTTCVHETIDRKSTTFGGYSIIDEMCVNYLYYYPQSVVNVCKSSVNNDTLARFFQLNGVPSSIKLISERYDSIEWNGENVKDLMEMYSTASLNMHCLQDDGTLFKDREVNWSSVWRPRAIAPPFDRSPQRVECPAIND
ncbi:unnamed protein product, partial [Mesorhabditis belari]|uniref:Tyramine beta-hydroxylase n=1 Tax=Mesorhabditis belari TaxID=2138241 RepID=A0AAF3FAE6_9BILA